MSENQITPQGAEQAGRPMWVKILLIILGIVFLLPGACGGFFLSFALLDWIGNLQGGTRDPYMPVVLFIGGGSLFLSLSVLGILLRFARWQAAPGLSLAIAIVSAVALILTFVATREDFNGGSSEDELLLIAVMLIGLFGGVLAPLQHWRASMKPAEGRV